MLILLLIGADGDDRSMDMVDILKLNHKDEMVMIPTVKR